MHATPSDPAKTLIYSVLPDPMVHDRWLVVRHSQHSRLVTAVMSNCTENSANEEAARLQREHDKRFAPHPPPRPHQMVLGFYGPEQGDT
jgi:hypothetical protein